MVWRFLKKLKIELPCDLAILFLGIYWDESTIQKETNMLMFTAALFAIAKTWKHRSNLSIHWHIVHTHTHTHTHTMEYYSAIKKNEITLFTTIWMDLKIIILSEVSQRKINIMWYHLYVEPKIWHKLTYEMETDSQTGRTDLWLLRGMDAAGWIGNLELADAKY